MIGEVFLQAVPCPAALKLLKPFPVPGLEGSSASMPMYPGEAELSRQAQAIPCGVKGHHYSHPTNRDPCDHPQSWKSNSIFDLHLGPSDQPHPGLPASWHVHEGWGAPCCLMVTSVFHWQHGIDPAISLKLIKMIKCLPSWHIVAHGCENQCLVSFYVQVIFSTKRGCVDSASFKLSKTTFRMIHAVQIVTAFHVRHRKSGSMACLLRGWHQWQFYRHFH